MAAPSTTLGSDAGQAFGTDPSEASVVHVVTPSCEAELGGSVEFPVPCPDAGARRPDAGQSGASDAAARDASSTHDASPDDAARPCSHEGCAPDAASDSAVALVDAGVDAGDASQFGACAEIARGCGHVYFETQLPASCSLRRSLGNQTLEVRFRVCETCGFPGSIDQYGLQIKRCDGCEQVYAEGASAELRMSANACRDLSWSNLRFEGTNLAGDDCVDVYANVGSSRDGMTNDAIHSVRVCRCDRNAGTCATCTGSSCAP